MARTPRIAVVLAGGTSRRFGAPKHLFSVGCKPAVRRVADALRGAGLEVYVSADDPVEGEVARIMAGPMARAVRDDPLLPCGGPARAMASSRALGEDLYLFAPADMPWLTSSVVGTLVAFSGEGLDSATVPAWRDGWLENLLVVLGRRCLEHLAEACRCKGVARVRPSDALRASARLRLLPAALLLRGEPSDKPLLHLNTPEDHPHPSRRGERGYLEGPIDVDNRRARSLYLEAVASSAEPLRSARLFAEEAETHLENGLHLLAAHAYRDAQLAASAAGSADASRLLLEVRRVYASLDSGGVELW